MPFHLSARPEAFEIDPARSALVVVDMQNGYCSPGGYFSHLGVDLSATASVVPAIQRALDAAYRSGIQVFWLQNGWDREQKEAGGPGSVNQRKGNSLKLMRERPELAGMLLTKGTWDYAFVDALQPRPGDIVIPKPRYSGFTSTALDSLLRSRGIDTMLVCGTATNVCVESTIRDAFFHEYFPVLIRDACFQAGPAYIQDATVYNVERFFGWTTTVDQFVEACVEPATA
ncbi:isochorismatase family protein [Ramlibacter sp. Leaf400]|uniref:isochorismatase family protein n=1 Tax=Ramlibacter sp. Leaf400 TaxID=1736365 RepID=UPI000701C2FE|nr:isochorismatase family protein [Ramlibacter sp. Leaf400]KQT11232.1 pyrimidine utilization protein B [Ramlibacter sp. Leaf400]